MPVKTAVSRAVSSGYGHPAVWAPVLALVAVAAFVAEVVQPWPEGGVLLTVTANHGLTWADVAVVGVVSAVSAAWIRWSAEHLGRTLAGR